MSVKRGAKATLRYEVLDATVVDAPLVSQKALHAGSGDTALVTIVVKSRAGKTVKTWNLGVQNAGVPLTCRYTVGFAAGSYRWYVHAHDAAGNVALKVGSNTLKVH